MRVGEQFANGATESERCSVKRRTLDCEREKNICVRASLPLLLATASELAPPPLREECSASLFLSLVLYLSLSLCSLYSCALPSLRPRTKAIQLRLTRGCRAASSQPHPEAALLQAGCLLWQSSRQLRAPDCGTTARQPEMKKQQPASKRT